MRYAIVARGGVALSECVEWPLTSSRWRGVVLQLPPGVIEHLLRPENKDLLTAVVTYHVISGNVLAYQVCTQARIRWFFVGRYLYFFPSHILP